VLRQRLADALRTLSNAANSEPQDGDKPAVDPWGSLDEWASMVRATVDIAHGDFQINCAMPMAKCFGGNPREIATNIIQALRVDDLCLAPEVAGPGFINLRLKENWIAASASEMLKDDRLGVAVTDNPRSIVIDFSSPNIAKPMHVGHIRSTVIGDAINKVIRFLGHHVQTDNHLGDWGTQFGMVIYGYRNFLDQAAFDTEPVPELLRIYRIVNGLIDHFKAIDSLPSIQQQCEAAMKELELANQHVATAATQDMKKAQKSQAAAARRLESAKATLESLERKIESSKFNTVLMELAQQHPNIATAVLDETAKLHAGDPDNLAIWHQLLPHCMDEVNRVYTRLNIKFDHILGESFYNPMLPGVVETLRSKGLASESEGAVCVFLDEFDAPMIVQKQDGAYLYSTTDLATLQYRKDKFAADEILYVVDFRQGDHFKKLFVVGAKLGLESIKLVHVSFGTVLDESGKPLKTRAGVLAGLVGLLDDAVARAYQVVCSSERSERLDPPLSEDEKKEIAEIVGIGAIKYADLAHHRTSDYKFSLEKMVSLDGNTSAYVQYAYARIQGILRSAGLSEKEIREKADTIICGEPAERSLLTSLLRFEDVLVHVREEYAPNLLVDYLYEIAKGLAVMYEHCMVLKAEDPNIRDSRLAIVTLAGRTLRKGLELLGIGVIPRM
jgi:arginyl-tRNA synthetase